jgi:hypothetical protein
VATIARDTIGQFDAAYTDEELVLIVVAVARAAQPGNPAAITQAAFDRSRARVADRWPDAPTARAIYQRLNQRAQRTLTWRRIVEGALAGGASARQMLVAGHRAAAETLDNRAVAFALLVVERHIPAREPITPGRYDLVRAEQTRDRAITPSLRAMLPTANQILAACGSWPDALRVAGLADRAATVETPAPIAGADDVEPANPGVDCLVSAEPHTAAGAASRPARARRVLPPSLPVVEAIGRHLELHGFLPTSSGLKQWATRYRISLGKADGIPWTDLLADFRRQWVSMGRWCPPAAPESGQAPPYEDLDPATLATLPRVRQNRWADIDDCARCVLAHWDTLRGREEPRQKTYGVWASGKPEYASPNVFARHGGFTAVKERARQLRHERGREPVPQPA